MTFVPRMGILPKKEESNSNTQIDIVSTRIEASKLFIETEVGMMVVTPSDFFNLPEIRRIVCRLARQNDSLTREWMRMFTGVREATQFEIDQYNERLENERNRN